jgi:acyl carrier protein
MSNLIGKIEKLFTDRLYLQVESPYTDLLDSGILDSMALVELLFGLEQEFGVRISISNLEIENFRSIASIAALVGGEGTEQVA